MFHFKLIYYEKKRYLLFVYDSVCYQSKKNEYY